MKRLLIINYYYPPIINGGVQRTYNFKKYLSQMGFRVTFLTTNSFGSMEDDEENLVLRFPDTGHDYANSPKSSRIGVLLFRIFRLAQVKLGLITDGKYYWKREVLKNLEMIMKSDQFDFVLASYPTPVNLELGETISRRYKIPLIVDYRDGLMYKPFPEIKSSLFVLEKRLKSLEKRLAEIASLQITVTPEMNDYYQTSYPKVKSIVITNGYDDEEEIKCEPIELPKGINILHTGSIRKSRKTYSDEELEKFFKFLFNISPKINFIFLGDYTKKEKEFFGSFKNVYVVEKTERKKALATQRAADALFLISGPEGWTSGKLYEYLFTGKPILNLSGHKGIDKIINGRQFGLTCTPNEHQEVENFIKLLETGNLKFEKGDLKQYTRRYQSELLAVELERIASKDRQAGLYEDVGKNQS